MARNRHFCGICLKEVEFVPSTPRIGAHFLCKKHGRLLSNWLSKPELDERKRELRGSNKMRKLKLPI